jgi:hypothetical protein
MTEYTSEFNGIASRLERLERENRLLKQTWIVSLLLLVCLVVMGQSQPRVIEAESFILKDAAGIKRAELAMSRENATLFFFDAKGRNSSLLGDGFIMLRDPEGNKPGFVMLATGNSQSEVTVQDADGFTATLGVTETVTQRTGEKHKTSAASLIMIGQNNKILWSAP